MRTINQNKMNQAVMCCCQAVCVNTVLFSVHYDT
jgi:hypothetical protein